MMNVLVVNILADACLGWMDFIGCMLFEYLFGRIGVAPPPLFRKRFSSTFQRNVLGRLIRRSAKTPCIFDYFGRKAPIESGSAESGSAVPPGAVHSAFWF